jgi:hypothetical protein
MKRRQRLIPHRKIPESAGGDGPGERFGGRCAGTQSAMRSHTMSPHTAAFNAEVAFPALPESAAQARAFLERTLRRWRGGSGR